MKNIDSTIFVSVASIFVANSVYAQITVDTQNIQSPGTLTSDPNQNKIEVNGGTVRGKNLFHSFREFNIQENQSVLFKNNFDSSLLVIRVNGQNRSVLNGILNPGGIKDVLFFNPSGVSILNKFQPININNLSISTAELVRFSDKFILSSNSFILPSFSFSSPEKLSFGKISNDILIENSGLITEVVSPNIIINNQPQGKSLVVNRGGRIFLSAANINSEGGLIYSPDGNITFKAVKLGEIDFTNPNKANDSSVILGNIALREFSFLDNSGVSGGEINLSAENISIESGSSLLSQVFNNQSGVINISANNNLSISGLTENLPLFQSSLSNPATFITRGFSSITTNSLGGNAPIDINVTARTINLMNGAGIGTTAVLTGASGNINLFADKINITGGGNISDAINTRVGTSTFSNQASGKINIIADDMKLLDGGQIFTISFSEGDAGALNIKSNNLILSGVRESISIRSAISSATVNTANSGNIAIVSNSLLIEDGATITTNSFGSGDTGLLSIRANKFVIDGSAQENAKFVTGVSSINFPDQNLPELIDPLNISIVDRLDGNVGELSILSNDFSIINGVVAVDNRGVGDAGKLSINSQKVRLKDSKISANTFAGNGGLLRIEAGLLSLLDSSLTSSSRNFGLGGGIEIDADVLIAQGQSRLAANAEQSNAGQISINAQGFAISPATIFEASSQLGPTFDGTVNINTAQDQINTFDKSILLEQPTVTLVEACNTSLSSVTQLGKGAGSEIVTDPQLLAASSLKRRLAYQSRFTYIDPDTGEEKPFKRWLGVQMRDDGMAEFVTDPSQSKGLQNLLSLLDKKCQAISNS